MRWEYGWSKVGEKAVLSVPVTRGLNVSFLGAISSKGCVDLKVPLTAETAPNKKRKVDSNTTISEKKARVGTTADHFYSFVKFVLKEIETNQALKEIKYLIVDNAAIHKRRDLELLVASSGMELVFLPPYSPALNAIEEFWSVCKAKVKQSNLSRKEQLTPRVREAAAKITLESCQGFCSYANDHIQYCLESRSSSSANPCSKTNESSSPTCNTAGVLFNGTSGSGSTKLTGSFPELGTSLSSSVLSLEFSELGASSSSLSQSSQGVAIRFTDNVTKLGWEMVSKPTF
ncbi:hypothetical protein CANMA_003404 [Candida margitis]|uniref:uncharacterized protein n=1 Tax=Candida margitis TaxID=1775924 RepID=UPI002227B72F|nr:uncharacterized protein CANMA_003404 [Candida margitis]KAI5965434.1 hypothetical protein CANMA_003404 [Candida margitis]